MRSSRSTQVLSVCDNLNGLNGWNDLNFALQSA